MSKKKNKIVPLGSNFSDVDFGIVPQNRKGFFEEGVDKLGRPFEKKLDDTGLYTKAEILKDGTKKLTIKKSRLAFNGAFTF